MFLVFKSERKRPVVDYQKLNSVTIKDSTTLSLIKDILDQIQRALWFIKIDLRNTFNQIQIRKEDEWKIVFRTQYETFEYQILSFRLINTFVIFQRWINQVLRKKLDIEEISYMDDILMTGKTIEQYRTKIC